MGNSELLIADRKGVGDDSRFNSIHLEAIVATHETMAKASVHNRNPRVVVPVALTIASHE